MSPSPSFIVKVQLSISSTEPVRQMLIYNEDHSLEFQGDASPDVVALMGDELKAYFHARLEGTRFVLGDIAEEQDW